MSFDFDMDRSRVAVVAGATIVLVISIVGFFVFGDSKSDVTSTADTAAASISTVEVGAEDANTATSVLAPPTSGGQNAADTAAQTSTASTATSSQTAETTTTDQAEVDSATTVTSDAASEGDLIGCPDGLVLVGSNGNEPICQLPGAGCPDGYVIIGGVNDAVLCKGSAGDVLRVSSDGSVTIDTSVPFNGPVCQISDSNGNIVELTLAVDEASCLARGGEYFPDGLG